MPDIAYDKDGHVFVAGGLGRMDVIGLLDHLPVVGQRRHVVDRTREPGRAERHGLPVRCASNP